MPSDELLVEEQHPPQQVTQSQPTFLTHPSLLETPHKFSASTMPKRSVPITSATFLRPSFGGGKLDSKIIAERKERKAVLLASKRLEIQKKKESSSENSESKK